LGAPGAGKGTQAEMLTEWLGIPHVASGDLFRENLDKETDLGRQARIYVERGDLVPDEITIQMVAERLSRPDCTEGFLLDGFPRTLAQAKALDEVLTQMDAALNVVPLIKVSESVALARLGGRWTCRNCGTVYHVVFDPPKQKGMCDDCGGELYQRPDDTPETHRHRIEVYRKQTMPLIEYYQKAKLLIEVNGEQPIEAVQTDLQSVVRVACGI
jgi:adenylate kinase